ncbi:MAG: hypothetical protein ABL973_09800 [Micropepsaceae bacterium]
MIRTYAMITTVIATSLVASGCNQQSPAKTEQQEKQVSELAAQPAPNAVERTASETANEISQVAAPNTAITPAELAAGLPVANVPNPGTTLSTAAVKTMAGEGVGEVKSVVVGPNAMADAIILSTGGVLNVGERAVSIEAKNFTYLKDRNLLVVSLTKADIEKLPTIPAPK